MTSKMLHIKPTTISSMPRVCSTINLLMLKRLLLLEAESKVVAGGPILLQRSYHQQHGFSKRYLRDKAELQRQQQRQVQNSPPSSLFIEIDRKCLHTFVLIYTFRKIWKS